MTSKTGMIIAYTAIDKVIDEGFNIANLGDGMNPMDAEAWWEKSCKVMERMERIEESAFVYYLRLIYFVRRRTDIGDVDKIALALSYLMDVLIFLKDKIK